MVVVRLSGTKGIAFDLGSFAWEVTLLSFHFYLAPPSSSFFRIPRVRCIGALPDITLSRRLPLLTIPPFETYKHTDTQNTAQ